MAYDDAYLRAMDTVQAPVLYRVCDLLPLGAPSLTFPSANPNTKEVCSGGHTIHVTALWTTILLQITFFSPLISIKQVSMKWHDFKLFSHQDSPILYTKIMLSVCPTAILVESGEKARHVTW